MLEGVGCCEGGRLEDIRVRVLKGYNLTKEGLQTGSQLERTGEEGFRLRMIVMHIHYFTYEVFHFVCIDKQ